MDLRIFHYTHTVILQSTPCIKKALYNGKLTALWGRIKKIRVERKELFYVIWYYLCTFNKNPSIFIIITMYGSTNMRDVFYYFIRYNT